MAYNKVVIRNGEEEEVVLDVSGTTVTAADLPKGKTALDKTGAVVTGTTPKIHSESGSLSIDNTEGVVSYYVRDDIVNITGKDIKVGASGPYSVALPANLRPGHYVWAHAKMVDSDGYVYTNKAYASIQYNSLMLSGVSENSVVDFNMSYIAEG